MIYFTCFRTFVLKFDIFILNVSDDIINELIINFDFDEDGDFDNDLNFTIFNKANKNDATYMSHNI